MIFVIPSKGNNRRAALTAFLKKKIRIQLYTCAKHTIIIKNSETEVIYTVKKNPSIYGKDFAA